MNFMVFLLSALLAVQGDGLLETCTNIVPARQRGAWISLKSFGAVGDGTTVNTAAFVRAIARIERRKARGYLFTYFSKEMYCSISLSRIYIWSKTWN